MTLVRKAYKEKITYWGNPRPDGTGGYTFNAPVQINCRWEENNEQFTDQNGEINVSRAVVYVVQDVEIGGYLFRGISTEASPFNVEGASKIRQVMNIPSLRTSAREIRAFL